MDESLIGLPTRDLLVRATIQRLTHRDESEVRILDICNETSLSTSVIYGHFGSRQGLIDAALLVMFEESVDALCRALEDASGEPADAPLLAVDGRGDDASPRPGLSSPRAVFFRVSAAALSRPGLRREFARRYASYRERVEDIFDRSISAGRLSAGRRPDQWADDFEGQILGQVLNDLRREPATSAGRRSNAVPMDVLTA